MARRSVMELLPEAVRSQIDEWVFQDRATIDQIHDYLKKLGAEALGLDSVPVRSTVGRYTASLNETAAAIKETNAVVKALVREIGPNVAEGEFGRALVEMLRTMIFRFMTRYIHEESEEETSDSGKKKEGGKKDKRPALDTKDFMALARAMKDMSSAMRLNQDYEREVREVAAKAAREEAAANVVKAGAELGLSGDTVDGICEFVLGVKLPKNAEGQTDGRA